MTLMHASGVPEHPHRGRAVADLTFHRLILSLRVKILYGDKGLLGGRSRQALKIQLA